MKKKAFLMLSGGVDSAVSLYLLLKKGYDVVACHIKGYNIDGCGVKDVNDADMVAKFFKVPFYVFDLEKEYYDKVAMKMVEGYRNGLTPNPDILCNSEIKFGIFLQKALEMGADIVATGHYAKIENVIKNGVNYRMIGSGIDENKDQSYFLGRLNYEQIERVEFPLGDLKKSKVRELALKLDVPVATKKDSQGVCFLGQITLREFLGKYLGEKKGDIVDEFGCVIGEHFGAYFFTIGQRTGLDLKNKGKFVKKDSEGNILPHYVKRIDVVNNVVEVAYGNENPLLYKKEVVLKEVVEHPLFENFLKESERGVNSLLGRVRYRQNLFELKNLYYKEWAMSNKKENLRVEFLKAQKFVAPGQTMVVYNKKKQIILSGVIEG